MQAQAMQSTTAADTRYAPSRASSGALVGGGALMITMYALQIVHGLRTGETMSSANSQAAPLLWLSGFTFTTALITIALGLIGIALWLRPRSPKLAVVAATLPLLASISPAILLIMMLVGTAPRILFALNGFGVIANLASATLLGIAVLRTKALPRSIGLTLLAVGLATFPLILLTGPAESLLPGYVAMDLPFPGWGAIFIGVGVALRRLTRAA